MDKPDCGSCDHQGQVEHKKKRVECRVDGQWHERGYRCEDFKEYVQGKTTKERRAEALEIRRERRAEAEGQKDKEFAEKMAQIERKHQDKLAQKDREHVEKLQEIRMEFDKKLWRLSWWWQLILVFMGGLR